MKFSHYIRMPSSFDMEFQIIITVVRLLTGISSDGFVSALLYLFNSFTSYSASVLWCNNAMIMKSEVSAHVTVPYVNHFITNVLVFSFQLSMWNRAMIWENDSRNWCVQWMVTWLCNRFHWIFIIWGTQFCPI